MATTPILQRADDPREAARLDLAPRYDSDSGLTLHVSSLPAPPHATLARVRLDDGHPVESLADAWLQPTEHVWWDGVPDLRQADALLGAIALREALRGGEWSGGPDEAKPLAVLHRHGAPPRISGDPEIHCSVAHDRDVAVAAVARGPIGVDLVGRARYDDSVLERIATVEEIEAVRTAGVAPEETASLLWAAKEAVLKGVGLELGLDPRRVFLRPDGESAWSAELPPRFHRPRRWRVETEAWSDRWVAVARPAPESAG